MVVLSATGVEIRVEKENDLVTYQPCAYDMAQFYKCCSSC